MAKHGTLRGRLFKSNNMHELARIRQAIREQRYRISSHANEEMSDDDLEAMDIEQAILTGTSLAA